MFSIHYTCTGSSMTMFFVKHKKAQNKNRIKNKRFFYEEFKKKVKYLANFFKVIHK